MSVPFRIVVLASGEGSNFQALIDAMESGQIQNAEIEALVCDQPGAPCIARAVRHGIPAHVLPMPRGAKRGSVGRMAYDELVAARVAAYAPDAVLLLGWMRLLSGAFLGQFTGKVVNLHPALPGTFPGTHAIERAFAAFRRGEIGKSGVMLHLVPDEGVDSGPVLKVREIAFRDDESAEEFEARVHRVEHSLIVELVREFAAVGKIVKEKGVESCPSR